MVIEVPDEMLGMIHPMKVTRKVEIVDEIRKETMIIECDPYDRGVITYALHQYKNFQYKHLKDKSVSKDKIRIIKHKIIHIQGMIDKIRMRE
jgi:hypothetical protein